MTNSKNPEAEPQRRNYVSLRGGQARYGAGKNFLLQALFLVFKDPFFVALALSLALNLLALYYFLLYKTTTLEVFFASNSAFYNWFSIVSTLLISLFFGIAMSFLIWQWRARKENIAGHTGNTFIASFFGAVSTGCPVCGTFLVSILGIGGGLMAFPFQGLEIKVISLGLLSFAIFSSAKSISNRDRPVCEPVKKETFLRIEKRDFVLTINKGTIKPLLPAFVGLSLLFLVLYLPAIADKFNFRLSFQPSSFQTTLSSGQAGSVGATFDVDSSELLQKINPPEGYTVDAIYGDIGPKLLAAGAIDFERMKSIYEKAGRPLTKEQLKILTEGSNQKIKITPNNSYFLLNFLWALGLANKNPILEEGPMVKYGKDQIGNFASTGGWTLGTKKATELYSKYEIISIDSKQQAILEEFAYNSYRPCCSNPTGFPDCNHGMAALALGEIMASQGASVEEIFEAFKYFNAFWFPQTYLDIAKYFQAKEGKDWAQVDGRLVAAKDYSTPQGWSRVRNWLKTNNLTEQAPSSGGGCGV